MEVLTLESLSFAYDRRTPVLRNLSMEFARGKSYAVVGRSGAGKTTLLSLMGGLMRPTKGKILFDGKDISEINQYIYRSRDIGLVFQSYNLLPKLNAIENVLLSMEIAGIRRHERRPNAEALLKKVGLTASQMKRRVLKLSGGQQQRVAIARAISYDANVILADEPTGNLDMETGGEIISILKDLANQEGKCVIIVTHSPNVAMMTDEIFQLPILSTI
jgi:putative ABC transport system ATP-binding protein